MRKREIIRYIKNRDYFTGKEVGYIANVAVSKAAGREGVREMKTEHDTFINYIIDFYTALFCREVVIIDIYLTFLLLLGAWFKGWRP